MARPPFSSSSGALWTRLTKRWVVVGVVILVGLLSSRQLDWAGVIKALTSVDVSAILPHQTVVIPPAGTLEVAFSPNQGSQQLVVKVIDSAKSEILLMAYSFTNRVVVNALLRAHKRGVKVGLIVDEKHNQGDAARAALSALSTAGVEVRTISAYAIHHDKVIIADRATVQLGSFNYSESAAKSNSENVLVVWDNPTLAESYLQHFLRNWNQGQKFKLRY